MAAMAESVNVASVMVPVLLVAPAATVKELNECSKARITFPPVPSSAEMLFIVIGIPNVFVTEYPSTNSCRKKKAVHTVEIDAVHSYHGCGYG